jgi:hypothetical protein
MSWAMILLAAQASEYFYLFTGRVKEISSSWVGIAGGASYCCLKLTRPGASFDYVELRDPKLPLDDQERDDADRLLEGCLTVDFFDETFYVFHVLRKDHDGDPDEEPAEDPDIDEE